MSFISYFSPMFQLAPLPFAKTDLEPIISRETLDYHYDKHQKAYVDKLNLLTEGTPYEHKSLEDLITTLSAGAIFNNAAQDWNHRFYRNCLQKPQEKNAPEGVLLAQIEKQRGSFATFQSEFATAGLNNFWSGWIWLVKDEAKKLAIVATANADNPLTQGYTPLLGLDIWEHAYYIDYRNQRAEYLDQCRLLINRDFVAQNYTK